MNLLARMVIIEYSSTYFSLQVHPRLYFNLAPPKLLKWYPHSPFGTHLAVFIALAPIPKSYEDCLL